MTGPGLGQPVPPADDDVVAWGADDGFAGRRFAGGRFAGLSARFGIQEHHVVRAVAAVGVGLAGLSLLMHWQVTSMTQQAPAESGRIETGVAGLAVWGAGYLLGLLGLVALTTAALYGAAALGAQVRIVGLGWGYGLLGLLVVIAVDLNRTSIMMGYSMFGGEPGYELSYGPGLPLALAGVAVLTAALHLSRRPGAASADEGADRGTDSGPGSGTGRRRAPRAEPPMPHGGPVDLEVTPAKPFVDPPRSE